MTDIWERRAELRRLQSQVLALRQGIQQEEQEKRRSKVDRLPEHPRKILGYLVSKHHSWEGDYRCIYRRTIENTLGLNRVQGGRALGMLKRLGLIQLHRGLFTDDGEVAGSGYAPTTEGARWWNDREKPFEGTTLL